MPEFYGFIKNNFDFFTFFKPNKIKHKVVSYVNLQVSNIDKKIKKLKLVYQVYMDIVI